MEAPTPRCSIRSSQLQPTAVNAILSEVREYQAQGRESVSLMRGEPDFRTPPHIAEAAVRALRDGRTGYPDNRGEPALREAVAQKLGRQNQLRYDPDSEILITTGATFGIYAALAAVLNEGDEVLVPDPIYDAYQSVIRLAGGRARPVPAKLDGGRFSLDRESLESARTSVCKVLLLNTPWNPVGTVFTEAELAEIGDFLEQRGVLLISDEIYEAITYDGRRHISPAALSPHVRAHSILVNSLSKTYAMTGWRVGYCAAPRDLLRAMFLVLQQSSRGPALFVQDAAVTALCGPQDCVAEMREEYARRRAEVLEKLAGVPGVQALPPEGGFFAMVDVRELGLSSDGVRRRLLAESGVVVVHGAAYGPGGEGTLRVSFASGGENLARGLERLRDGLEAIGARPQAESAASNLGVVRPVRDTRLDMDTVRQKAPVAEAGTPVPQADASKVNVEALRRELESEIEGEVRFDRVSRALYSTDASVYQIEPLGVVVVKSGEDVMRTVRICSRFRCPITVRGGGTSQAGQAIGPGLQLDTSKFFNRLLEVNASERWARVEPGIVLDELNQQLRSHGLQFAPDVSTSNRATVGGMMANNSSGAHSVIYGKTVDHVLEQQVVLADGSVAHLRPLSPAELAAVCAGSTLEAAGYRVVRQLAAGCAEEIERRYPKILRRVGGYNLDAFVRQDEPFNLSKLMVGSEGTLGVVVEAKLNLVPLPGAKALLVIHFNDLLEALAATPVILEHAPAAVEVLDKFILDCTRENPALESLRDFIQGDPGGLLIVELRGVSDESLPPKLEELERDLSAGGFGYHCHRAMDPAAQSRIWSLRKAALGLSMAMKGDAKSLSFVEDTAVAPEKLRDYIDRFLQVVRRNGTTAGVYAHASVGCLHVRPMVNLKTEEGVRQFEAIANEIADLVLEYDGALSGEHGDGLLRSPFLRKMFGPVLYEAFRTIKRTFDPLGIFNPGKIVDAPPLTANLRYGPGYQTPDPPTFFDYSEHGGLGRAVEMCSGLGACRKKLEGTMCPSYMATLDEMHTTRGRANVLRLAMDGRLGQARLGDEEVLQVLDLCLECRACKVECPVGVDMARYKSEFLADYWTRHGLSWRARMLSNIHLLSEWGSRWAPVSNWVVRSLPARWLNEKLFGIDARRKLPRWRRGTLAKWFARRNGLSSVPGKSAAVVLFNDTFTNYYEPEIGIAVVELLEAAEIRVQLGRHRCCGRPLISQGLLARAREHAQANTELLFPLVEQGSRIVFCEPSCLSAMREDAPALLRGESQRKARVVAGACLLFEEFLEQECRAGRLRLALKPGPRKILLHGHCHQKAMGLLPPARALLSRIPECTVVDLDAGCCGMAGSFGYLRAHYDLSRKIGERRLLPAARGKEPDTVLVAAGTSCRHQVEDFSGQRALHPAVLLRSLLASGSSKA